MTARRQISYVSFDSSSKEFILSALDKSIDSEGYIIESSTGERVLAQDGEALLVDEWGGIRKGSEIFFRKDLPSVLDALQHATEVVSVG